MPETWKENENGYFTKRQVRFFDTIEDRADRLMNKTAQLLEYAGQVKDAYQSAADARQNKSMQLLTIISTIFLPLTLITSWYGMNFKDMPELEDGYPVVILGLRRDHRFLYLVLQKEKSFCSGMLQKLFFGYR